MKACIAACLCCVGDTEELLVGTPYVQMAHSGVRLYMCDLVAHKFGLKVIGELGKSTN